jgi:AraC-like DNA-binding protein
VIRKQRARVAISSYREVRPPSGLADYVLCFWTQTVSPTSRFYTEGVADCCVDIVLKNRLPMVIGPWTEPFDVESSLRNNHPRRALPSRTCFKSICPCHFATYGAAVTWNGSRRLPKQRPFPAQMRALETVLLRRFANARLVDLTVQTAIRWMARHPTGRVEHLSERLGISSRQLQRRFQVSAGYGPKMFQSVLRFQRLLNESSRASNRWMLTDLATHAGYSDQAHMTREVQRFAGRSPASLLRSVSSTLSISDLFKTADSLTGY